MRVRTWLGGHWQPQGRSFLVEGGVWWAVGDIAETQGAERAPSPSHALGNVESFPGPLPPLRPHFQTWAPFPALSISAYTFTWLVDCFQKLRGNSARSVPHEPPSRAWPWSSVSYPACLHVALPSPRLKTISLVIRSTQEAEDALRTHEEQLKEAQAVPAALPELEATKAAMKVLPPARTPPPGPDGVRGGSWGLRLKQLLCSGPTEAAGPGRGTAACVRCPAG